MRFHKLLESTYNDLLRDEIVSFIKQHENRFSRSYVTFSNSNTPRESGNGIKIIPLMQFVKQPMKYEDMFNYKNLIKLSVDSKILNISQVNSKLFNHLAVKLGIENPSETYKQLISGFNNVSKSYGYALNYLLNHNIDNQNTTPVSNSEYQNRLISLGYTGVVDTSININNSILSNTYPSIGYLFNNSSITIEDVISDNAVSIERKSDDIITELAQTIANALNSELNHDDPYHRGLDHYFWTFDGMQIRITETFTQSNNDNDGRSYILDIETPYGILYHVTHSDDSHLDIKKDVESRYTKMTEPLGNWRPLDRDIFLTDLALEYKDYELKLDDIVKEVKKYYEEMRQFGLRYKIQLQPLNHYSEYDLSFMSGIIDRFSQNSTAMTFLNKISDNGDMIDMDIIDDYFPRQRLPKKMTFEQLKKMALIYDIAKKLQPKKTGWRVFHYSH